jgi:hypothetical protein
VRVWSSTTTTNLDRGNIYLCVGLSAAVPSLPSVDASSHFGTCHRRWTLVVGEAEESSPLD